MYLWQLAGVHAVNKRVQGVEVPSFERYVDHRRVQLVRHAVSIGSSRTVDHMSMWAPVGRQLRAG